VGGRGTLIFGDGVIYQKKKKGGVTWSRVGNIEVVSAAGRVGTTGKPGGVDFRPAAPSSWEQLQGDVGVSGASENISRAIARGRPFV